MSGPRFGHEEPPALFAIVDGGVADACDRSETPRDPNDRRILSIDHSLEEVARINGDTTTVEGGLPADASYIAGSGHIDLVSIPADDEATWELIRSGRIADCFELPGLGFAHTEPLYHSAWLKTHFPVEFLTGLFEYDPGGLHRGALLAQARRIGVPVLPVDINASSDRHRVERISSEVKGIRLSLRDVSGLSEAMLGRVLEGQPFGSITEVHERVRAGRPLMMRMARSGVFDSLVTEVPGAPAIPDASRRRSDIIAFVRQLSARPRKQSRGHEAMILSEAVLGVGRLGDPSLRTEPGAVGHPIDDGRTDGDPRDDGRRDPRGDEDRRDDDPRDDAVADLLDRFRPMLERLGVTSAASVLRMRPGAWVLLAGSQTEGATMSAGPGAIGFEDGTGHIDLVSSGAGPGADEFWGSGPMVVRGRTRGVAGQDICVEVDEAHDLQELWSSWQEASAEG